MPSHSTSPQFRSGFETAVVAACRAKQLIRGCTPRLEGNYKATTMARLEVVAGVVARLPQAPVTAAIGRVAVIQP